MQTVFPQVVVSVRTPRADIALPQVCDVFSDLGPLAGLCAGLDYASQDGVPWIFAELVEGGSLADWIEDRRLYAGPELTLGMFMPLGGDKTARFLTRGAAFFGVGLGEHAQVEAIALTPDQALGGGGEDLAVLAEVGAIEIGRAHV